jgi:hypothetical protein
MAMGQEINVVGSNGLRGYYWPADIDQFQLVAVRSAANAVEKMRRCIKGLAKVRGVRTLEVKWGLLDGKALKLPPSVFLTSSAAKLSAALQNGGRCKLDAAAWVGDCYVEFSCVYVFSTKKELNPLPDQIESLQEDAEEYAADGQWFKVAKRFAAILRAKGHDTQAYDTLFNSDLGLLYSVLCDISTLHVLRSVPPKRRAAEMDALLDRIGGVRISNESLEKAILLLRAHGNLAEIEALIAPIVNNGAKAFLQRR